MENYRKKTPEGRAREIVLHAVKGRKSGRPMMVGEFALAIGSLWTLSEVETLLDRMVEESVLRRATEEETLAFQVCSGYFGVV